MPRQLRGWCELPPLPSGRYDVTKAETDAARVSSSHLLTDTHREGGAGAGERGCGEGLGEKVARSGMEERGERENGR